MIGFFIRDSNGYLYIDFLNIYILFITYRKRNLDILKLSIKF